jgi:hypothetical protein
LPGLLPFALLPRGKSAKAVTECTFSAQKGKLLVIPLTGGLMFRSRTLGGVPGTKSAPGAGGRRGRKEKTGLVSQGMAEEAGEFRMSTT